MTGIGVTLPETCDVAFKEWETVCDALASGGQSLILRKGGIDEGAGGFKPEHEAFWLYPTNVHQQQQGVKPEANETSRFSATPETEVPIQSLACIALIRRIERVEELEALDSLHIWTQETVEKRFHYRTPGLWAIGVRIYRRPQPVILPVTPEYLGCKTWVPLGKAISTRELEPVLPEQEFQVAIDAIRKGLSSTATT